MSHPAPDHQPTAAADVEDLLTMLDRYRKAVALLDCLPRSSPEYASQLKVEMALSRQIHELGQDRARGIKD